MPAESGPVASGLVVVDKAGGMTSHDVVARVRRLAGTRKVGHAGTLDPMATGVLIIGVERATRLLGHLMLTEKRYDATVRLGVTTTTDDADGEVVGEWSTAALDEDQIRAAFAEQVGELLQVPSAVSAIKVDGKRAYQRVREGETVELKARPVTVHELSVHRLQRVATEAGGSFIDAEISVRCSSGTYIRAIARDVGESLGVGGHLTAPRRTAVGPYGLDVAHTLDKLALARARIDRWQAGGGQAIDLEVDGGVKADNIADIRAAGADAFVAGSAIFGRPDYPRVIAELRDGIARGDARRREAAGRDS